MIPVQKMIDSIFLMDTGMQHMVLGGVRRYVTDDALHVT